MTWSPERSVRMERSERGTAPIERDRLFDEFRPLVQRLVARYGVSEDLRQELPGELYCQFSLLLGAYDPARGVPLRGYLVRMLSTSAYAFARSHWRRRCRYVSFDACLGSGVRGSEADLADMVIETSVRDELRSRLPRALSQLSPRQRSIVVSRFYEGRSFEDIAQELGIQTVSVRSLLRYALARLRQHPYLRETAELTDW